MRECECTECESGQCDRGNPVICSYCHDVVKESRQEMRAAIVETITIFNSPALCCGICEFSTEPPDYEVMARHLGAHAVEFQSKLRAVQRALSDGQRRH